MKFATLCADDLADKIKTVQGLSQKTITVLSVEDLLAKIASVPKPAVGVLYEGARPLASEGGKQIAISAEVVYSVILVTETSVISPKVDTKAPAHETLDALREAIHGTQSPTGHKWRWYWRPQPPPREAIRYGSNAGHVPCN